MAIDAAAGTGSLRTLGTSGTSACAGNDARLSDARTPTGSASGDLSGTYPGPTVSKMNGNTIPVNSLGFLFNNGLGNLAWDSLGGTSPYVPYSQSVTAIAATSMYYDSVNYKFGIGTAAAPPTELTVLSTSNADPRGIMSAQYSTDAEAARIYFRKSRGSFASPSTVVTSDYLGKIYTSGYDGTNFIKATLIESQAVGTIGTNRVPSILAFCTNTNAAPSVLTEGMRITEKQNLLIGTTSDNGNDRLQVSGNIYASGDFYTAAFQDYSGTSTIVGWSSRTTTQIYYKKIGHLVFIHFQIQGTSNATNVTFTIPYTPSGTIVRMPIRQQDNGGAYGVGLASVEVSGNTVTCYTSLNNGAWTNSGQKTVQGQFFFDAGS